MSDKESSDGSQAGDRKGMKGRFLIKYNCQARIRQYTKKLNSEFKLLKSKQLFKTPSFLKANNNNTHVQAKEVKKLN